MKNLLKLSILLALGFGINACKDKEEPSVTPVVNTSTCKQSDWVGSYSGIMDCDGDTATTVFTISASGSDALIIKYDQENLSAEFDPITPSGCKLDKTTSESGITLHVEANIDGDKLTFKEIFTFDGESDTCMTTAMRK